MKETLMKRLRRQYPLLLIMALLVASLNLFGSTFSWFTQSDQVDNVLKTRDLLFSFRVDEDFQEPSAVIPGQKVEKAVRAENNGDLPGFVRLLALTEIISKDGTPLPADPSVIKFEDVNEEQWLFVDGWWYYLDVLEPGEKTPSIFSGVTFAGPLPDEYKNAGMKIEVKLEAVDIYQWSYREGWWSSGAAPAAPFDEIDNILCDLALAR